MKIEAALKSDKKALMRFYKQQHYSANLMGLDSVYLIKVHQVIIAAVIVSYLHKDNQIGFLHGLVVDNNYHRQGLAQQLLRKCTDSHHQLVCFVKPELAHFYQQNEFKLGQLTDLSLDLAQRYSAYQNKWPELNIFIYSAV
ncbi:GNAT family N-acetyltransferase [Thalassotalea ganghwensis]